MSGFTPSPTIPNTGAANAPTTGQHNKNELWVDTTGDLWVCTVSGTPGTWINASLGTSSVSTVFTRTGAVVATTGDYTAAQVTNAADLSSAAEQDFTGLVGMDAGSNTGDFATFTTNAAVSSGVAFTPLATSDSVIYVPVNATTAGTVVITMGPSTGAENAVIPTSNIVALSEPVYTLRVPMNWKVIVTKAGTTVVIGTVNIQAC
jgi:hypothetical protein